MKITSTIFFFLVNIILFSCKRSGNSDNSKLVNELRDVEHSFSDSTEKYGFVRAALMFSAEDVIIFSDTDTAYTTIDSLRSRAARIPKDAPPPPYKLSWTPDIVSVSASGDMGYSYGHYHLTTKDSATNETTKTGLYSSIWKKINGKWKLVLD